MGVGAGSVDGLVFWAVAAARFLLPLSIPRYPLPGILASLILDGIDQTLFQTFTHLPLDGYQGYDKALDIYYLSIAYISTLRNWAHRCAFGISRILFYYRLVGVALFELTGQRPLLLVFPNTFEFFFIFYESYRLRWDPRRMGKALAIAAAAAIWLVVKLPQEYWLHIAGGDTTDWIKVSLLQVSLDTPWSELLQARLAGLVAAVAAALMVLTVASRWLARRLPPADRRVSFSANAYRPRFTDAQIRSARTSEAHRIVDGALLEKIAMVTLVCVSFGQVLPDAQSNPLQPALGVAIAVLVNTALSHWLARRGFGWAFTAWQFLVMGGINVVLAIGYVLLQHRMGGAMGLRSALLFALLLTLLVPLYDRYRQVYLMRFGLGDRLRQ